MGLAHPEEHLRLNKPQLDQMEVCILRFGILDFHKLKVTDFKDEEEALQAAMDYVAAQRQIYPDIAKKHPDLLMPNAKCSQYWYVMCEGVQTNWERSNIKEYGMDSKLNDKDLAKIENVGIKDQALGMALPALVNMDAVKKEFAGIDDLDKLCKDVQQPYLMDLYSKASDISDPTHSKEMQNEFPE